MTRLVGWWKSSSGSARIAALGMLVLLAPGTLLLVADKVAPDSDQDGMSNLFESFFGLDPHNPADATQDQDADTLIARDEFPLNTDPFEQDTDQDLFPDALDHAPLSRVHYDLGNPQFTQGLWFDYAGPDWEQGAFQLGGQWVTNEPTGWSEGADETRIPNKLIFEFDINRLIIVFT